MTQARKGDKVVVELDKASWDPARERPVGLGVLPGDRGYREFTATQDIEDVDARLRHMAERFLESLDGKASFEKRGGVFPWAAVLTDVPDDAWRRSGLDPDPRGEAWVTVPRDVPPVEIAPWLFKAWEAVERDAREAAARRGEEDA